MAPEVGSNWIVLWIPLSLEAWLDDTVGLHGGDSNVGDPQADKESGSDSLDGLGSAQLAAHRGVTPEQEDHDGNQGLNAENGYRESQAVEWKCFSSL